MRRYSLILFFCPLVFLTAGSAFGDTFKLMDGTTVSGDIVDFDDNGLRIRLGDGNYSRTSWTNFSQSDLKELSKNDKITPYVEPYIEPAQEERVKPAPIATREPDRLKRAEPASLLGAMFSSPVGLLVLIFIYAGNIYAGYEIAIYRSRPTSVVCGLAAIPFLGVASNIALAFMKHNVSAEDEDAPSAADTETSKLILPTVEAVNSMADAPAGGTTAPGGLKLAHDEDAPAASVAQHTVQTFQRGAFTFNRRFFETKFASFFGVVRRDAEKDLVISVKSMRGLFVGQRITRISSSDVHLEVHRGHASEEVVVPFSEIQEIQLKHKDA